MTSDPNFWYTLAFILFFIGLGRPLWRALSQMLDDKRTQIQRSLEEAATMKKEAQAFLETCQRQHAEAKAQEQKILDHIALEVRSLREEAKNDLSDFLTNQERQLEDRLNALEASALKELKNSIINTAVASALEVIEKTIDKKLDAQIIQETIAGIAEHDVPVHQ